jgi:hypothetical protein
MFAHLFLYLSKYMYIYLLSVSCWFFGGAGGQGEGVFPLLLFVRIDKFIAQ